jgi:hypothetical protein
MTSLPTGTTGTRHWRPLRLLGFVITLPIVMVIFATLAFAQPVSPSPPPTTPATAEPPSSQTLDWRKGMARARPEKPGCFTSTYPNTQWQEVPCVATRGVPFKIAKGPRGATLGAGNDVAVQVSTGSIASAVGSFDSVTGVTSVSSLDGSNDYSLQVKRTSKNGDFRRIMRI